MTKRILIFTTAFRPLIGGSELALENIIRRLPNIFFDVITPRLVRGTKKTEAGENFLIHRVGPTGKLGKYLFPIFGWLKAGKLIRKNDISIIHAYQASYGGGAAWLTKIFNRKIKFILTLQEGKNLAKQSWLVNFFRKLIIRKADVVTAISEYLKKYVYSVAPRAEVIVIPNGVDFQKFHDTKKDELILEPLGIKGEDRIIVHTGRLVKKNGLPDLIEAVGLVKKDLPRIKLLLVGDGVLLPELKTRVEDLGLKNEVIFLGEIEHDKLPIYLKAADVFVRPSLSEGLGNSFLEAMAVGIPVIGTPVGGITDFITDGETGLLCRPGDPPGLAATILKILSDRQLAESMVKKAQELVAEKYDWNAIARQFEKFYDAI